MDKKKIQTYVLKSYTKDRLNQNRVKVIAGSLKRSELKIYIQELKNAESKRNVIVILPLKSGVKTQLFERLFPNKKIVYQIDPTLIAGVKIIDNDRVFEFDLKDRFQNILANIKESYD